MQTRQKNYSLLGFGCMRLPKRGAGFDYEECEREILRAYHNGVNYYDTAYIYPGNEELLGKILEKNRIRENVVIATKIPHCMIHSLADAEKYFRISLKRLRTDYVDNLLIHMLPDIEIWNRLKGYGIVSWIEEKKKSGQIRSIGFSFHGNSDAFLELLDAYPWDFCQCQYNYMDENTQAGRKGVQHAYSLGIPVIIMEGLRGGRLVNALPPKARTLFAQTEPSWKAGNLSGSRLASPAEWGLRWLYEQKEIAVVLSGMNSMEMLDENIRIANETRVQEFSEADQALIEKVRAAINEKIKVPCTGCGYCMPCPHGVDIPGCFRCYNERYTDSYGKSMKEYMMTTAFRAKKSYASLCVQCGRCEQHCPQAIPIREKLKEVSGHMEGPVFRCAEFFSRGMFRGDS